MQCTLITRRLCTYGVSFITALAPQSHRIQPSSSSRVALLRNHRPLLHSTHRHHFHNPSSFAMAAVKPQVVFVLGAPGAGKGTQCSKIVNEFGYVHLSAGDLLREERQRPGSEFGELIEDCIRNGKIVPVEVTCSLLENAIRKCQQENNQQRFLVDGFPRNKDNLDGWTRQMSAKTQLQAVLVFECTEAACVERCLKRGAEGSGRSDDNLESLKKRFNTFFGDSVPIIQHYEAERLVHRIDGTASADEVFEKVRAVFGSVLDVSADEKA